MTEETGAPEIPQPDKPPVDDAAAAPSSNGNGNHAVGGDPRDQIQYLDPQKTVEWMKQIDRDVKVVRVGQLVLCGAVLLILVTVAKPKVSP